MSARTSSGLLTPPLWSKRCNRDSTFWEPWRRSNSLPSCWSLSNTAQYRARWLKVSWPGMETVQQQAEQLFKGWSTQLPPGPPRRHLQVLLPLQSLHYHQGQYTFLAPPLCTTAILQDAKESWRLQKLFLPHSQHGTQFEFSVRTYVTTTIVLTQVQLLIIVQYLRIHFNPFLYLYSFRHVCRWAWPSRVTDNICFMKICISI